MSETNKTFNPSISNTAVMTIPMFILLLVLHAFPFNSYTQIPPFTSSTLTEKRDLSELMVEGIDKFLLTQTDHVQKRDRIYGNVIFPVRRHFKNQ